MTVLSATTAVESLLAFWASAGVDACLLEDTVDRIAEPVRPVRQAVPLPVPAAAPAVRTAPDLGPALTEARRLANGAADLEALKEAIAGFEGCGLRYEGARQAVFARGAPDAPVMIVGEGPGGDEDAQGLPFVGRAGQLLDRMLKAADLQDRVFITNTVFWRPPGNRTPSQSEQAVCAPFLERAIQLVQPKFLLLVGGAAAKSMLKREEGILSMRGRWFEWKSEDGSIELPAMPTLHPAFLLRQPGAKKRAWQDLLLLSERVARPERGI